MKSSLQQVLEIVTSGQFNNTCSACVATLNIFKTLAIVVPDYTADALYEFCIETKLGNQLTCQQTFGATDEGQVFVQVLANADVSGLDGRSHPRN